MRRFSLSLAFVLLAAPAWTADKLTVYTYESFTAEWGPGPQVEKAFEAQCGCDVEFVSVADGVALLNRVKLEGEATRADVVLGLDTNLIAEARSTRLFVPHGVKAELSVPDGWSDDVFLPYDYGFFSVVYNRQALPNPPKTLHELVEGDPNQKIVIQDPRTSTPGLGLVLWMRAVYGDKAGEAWAKLKGRVLTVTPGWSEAYGLFTKGEAPMVLSYTTSPAYHLIAEKVDTYQATAFEEGNYMQVEVAGVTKSGAKNPLAAKFMAFMVSPAFQDIIPETNWMYPAAKTSSGLDSAFGRLPQPVKTLMFAPDVVERSRKAWVDEWLNVMSQ